MVSVSRPQMTNIQGPKSPARAAATRAFLVTGAGGLAMLAGLIILTIVGGTTTISGLLADPPSGTLTDVALVLVLLGGYALRQVLLDVGQESTWTNYPTQFNSELLERLETKH